MSSTRKRKTKVKSKAKSKQSSQTRSSHRIKTTAARAIKPKSSVWRDSSGRFASPVYFDGYRYRSKTTGKVTSFASRAAKPSIAAKRAKIAGKPVKAKPRKPVKAKPRKPVKAKPREPVEAKPREPVEAKPREPVEAKPREPVEAKPVKPPKTPISRLFKTRDQLLREMTPEDSERVQEAIETIEQFKDRARREGLPFGPNVVSDFGYEYYELIAAIEKMSPSDIYTLMTSER